MKTVRNVLTYVHGESPGDLETPKGKSMTVPDMTMSLEELISRHTRGQPVNEFTPSFNDEFIPDVKSMDLTEIADLAESKMAENINRVQTLLDNQRERKAKRKAQKSQGDFKGANENQPD